LNMGQTGNRILRLIRSECKRVAEKSRRSADLGRQAAIHALNAGGELSRLKSALGLRGSEWDGYCREHFGVGGRTASQYMLISRSFPRPNDLPDGVDGIRSAVRAARGAGSGPIRGRVPKWKSIEPGAVSRFWKAIEAGGDPLRLERSLGGGWAVWSHEARCGRAGAGGSARPGACDILLKREGATEWVIVEVKSQPVTGEAELEQLIEYMRSFRRRQRGRVFGVLVCENPARGLRAACRRAGVLLRTYGLACN